MPDLNLNNYQQKTGFFFFILDGTESMYLLSSHGHFTMFLEPDCPVLRAVCSVFTRKHHQKETARANEGEETLLEMVPA